MTIAPFVAGSKVAPPPEDSSARPSLSRPPGYNHVRMEDWLYYSALIVLLFAGLFINILGLPGLWLMVLGHGAYGLVTGWDVYVGWPSFIIIVVLALLAEVVEFVAGAAGSKVAGGSKRGMAGAIVGGIVGGIVGTPILPIVGTIVGAVAGAGLGAALIEIMIGRSHGDSVRIGIGAAKGRFWGIVAKTGFGCAMLLVSIVTAWPRGAPAAVPPATAPSTAPAPTTVPAPETAPAPEIPPAPETPPAPEERTDTPLDPADLPPVER